MQNKRKLSWKVFDSDRCGKPHCPQKVSSLLWERRATLLGKKLLPKKLLPKKKLNHIIMNLRSNSRAPSWTHSLQKKHMLDGQLANTCLFCVCWRSGLYTHYLFFQTPIIIKLPQEIFLYGYTYRDINTCTRLPGVIMLNGIHVLENHLL